ncbi:hypothetical protein HK097_003764 [Rhizophlyctis rosea]|uniref:Uncharacterized protein n=1 Tax=Rhizophlyctis rosea TaxID=64517 RepID=A0AAD5SGF5_9FUNG|nr:hypothetical protein HK097_003764 [Rhizophlyctis rosea]
MGLKAFLPGDQSSIAKSLASAASPSPVQLFNLVHVNNAVGQMKVKKDGPRTAVVTSKLSAEFQQSVILVTDAMMAEVSFREEFMRIEHMDPFVDLLRDSKLLPASQTLILDVVPKWGTLPSSVRYQYAFNILYRDICVAFGKPVPQHTIQIDEGRPSMDALNTVSERQNTVRFAPPAGAPPRSNSAPAFPTPPSTPQPRNAQTNPYDHRPAPQQYATVPSGHSGPFSWRPAHAQPGESITWESWKRKIEEDLLVAEGCLSMLKKAIELSARWDKTEEEVGHNRLVQVYWKECRAIQRNLPGLMGEVEDEGLLVKLVELAEAAERASQHFASVLAVKRSERAEEMRRLAELAAEMTVEPPPEVPLMRTSSPATVVSARSAAALMDRDDVSPLTSPPLIPSPTAGPKAQPAPATFMPSCSSADVQIDPFADVHALADRDEDEEVPLGNRKKDVKA